MPFYYFILYVLLFLFVSDVSYAAKCVKEQLRKPLVENDLSPKCNPETFIGNYYINMSAKCYVEATRWRWRQDKGEKAVIEDGLEYTKIVRKNAGKITLIAIKMVAT